jgi:hypothetical protein
MTAPIRVPESAIAAEITPRMGTWTLDAALFEPEPDPVGVTWPPCDAVAPDREDSKRAAVTLDVPELYVIVLLLLVSTYALDNGW